MDITCSEGVHTQRGDFTNHTLFGEAYRLAIWIRGRERWVKQQVFAAANVKFDRAISIAFNPPEGGGLTVYFMDLSRT